MEFLQEATVISSGLNDVASAIREFSSVIKESTEKSDNKDMFQLPKFEEVQSAYHEYHHDQHVTCEEEHALLWCFEFIERQQKHI